MTDDSSSSKRLRSGGQPADVDRLSQALRSLVLIFGSCVDEVKSRRVSKLWKDVSEHNPHETRKKAIERVKQLSAFMTDVVGMLSSDQIFAAYWKDSRHLRKSTAGVTAEMLRNALAEREEVAPGTTRRFLQDYIKSLLLTTVLLMNKDDTVLWLARDTKGATKSSFKSHGAAGLQDMILERMGGPSFHWATPALPECKVCVANELKGDPVCADCLVRLTKQVTFLKEWVPVIDARQAAKRQRRSGKTQESKGDSKQDLKAQGKQMIENVRNTLRGAEFQVNVEVNGVRTRSARVSVWDAKSKWGGVTVRLLEDLTPHMYTGLTFEMQPKMGADGVFQEVWATGVYGGTRLVISHRALLDVAIPPAGSGSGSGSGSAS